MMNQYRLSSSAFKRECEEDKIAPMKIFFLSVEGERTEREYFEGISKYRTKLGINMQVNVEILRRSRKDAGSAPKHVLELLEEYLRLRETNREDMMPDIPAEIVTSYGEAFVRAYLDGSKTISQDRRQSFTTALKSIGYDLSYRKYLQQYNNEFDEFGILIDRDKGSNSEEEIMECIRHCRKKGYGCYISNPCFEFWLLLHLSDVQEEYQDRMSKIKENCKMSNQHTFVSYEVSRKARHGKKRIKFEKNYLQHVDEAVERASAFPTEPEQLVDAVGCNIGELIKQLKIG